jgi:group I intron endonuclease
MSKSIPPSGIYKIQSIINENKYIGSAIHLNARRILHFLSLKNNIHYNKHLQRHYNKYGIKDLQFSIIELCPKEKLIEREQYYMDLLKPEFNILPKAGSMLGYKFPIETKPERSERAKKRWTPKRRKSFSIARKKYFKNNPNANVIRGENHPMKKAEARNRMKGDNNVAKRPEVREKISKAITGTHKSLKTRKKFSKIRIGIPKSAEVGKKNTERLMKWWNSPEGEHCRIKSAIKNSGENNSSKRPEVQQKIRKSIIAKWRDPEHRNKRQITYQNRPIITCPYCNLQSKSFPNMQRYHFDNCKLK